MNNQRKRLLSMVLAIAMMITSLNVPTFADGLLFGNNEVISGSAISVNGISTNPISDEAVFAPDYDADVASYGTPAAVSGFYQMNDIAFVGSEESPVAIDAGWYSYEDGESFEYAARTLGQSSDKGGIITFATDRGAKVKIYAYPTGGGRSIGLMNGVPDGAVTEDDMFTYMYDDVPNPNIYDFSVESAGQYSIVTTEGYDISKVVVTPLEDNELNISANAEDVVAATAVTGTLATGETNLKVSAANTPSGVYIQSASSGNGATVNSKNIMQIVPSVSGTITMTTASRDNAGLSIYKGEDSTTGTLVITFDTAIGTNSTGYSIDVEANQIYTFTHSNSNGTRFAAITLTASGGSETQTATATFATMTNGTAAIDGVTANADGSYTLTQGTAYTVTATPDAGYVLDTITAEGATVDGNKITPNAATVTITVTFKAQGETPTVASLVVNVVNNAAADLTNLVVKAMVDGDDTATKTATASDDKSTYTFTDLVIGKTYKFVAEGLTDLLTAFTPESKEIAATNENVSLAINENSSTPTSIRVWDFSSNTTLQNWAGTSSKDTLDGGNGLTFKSESTGDKVVSTSDNAAIPGVSEFTKYFELGGNGGATKRLFTIADAKAGDKVTIYYGASTDREVTVTNGSSMPLSAPKTGGRNIVNATPLTYTVTSDGPTTFYCTGQLGIYYISIASSTHVDPTKAQHQFTISSDDSAVQTAQITGAGGSAFTVRNGETIGLNPNTVFTITAKDGYDITEPAGGTFTTGDASETVVTTTITFTKHTTPKEYATVSPDTDGNYKFTANANTLTSDKTYGGAYVTVHKDLAAETEITDYVEADNNVAINTGNAVLNDTSKNQYITKLHLPMNDVVKGYTDGKVTITGTLQPNTADPLKWSMLELFDASGNEMVAIRPDSTHMHSLASYDTSNSETAADTATDSRKLYGYTNLKNASNTTLRADNSQFTYTLVINYATGNAELTIGDYTATRPLNSAGAIGEIVAVTAYSAERTLTVGDITITHEDATAPTTVAQKYTATGLESGQKITLTNKTDATKTYTISANTTAETTIDIEPGNYTVAVSEVSGYTSTVTPAEFTASADTAVSFAVTNTAVSSSNYAQMGIYKFGTAATGGNYNFTAKATTTKGNVTAAFRSISTSDASIRKNDGDNKITFTLENETVVAITSTGKGMVAVAADGTEYSFAVGDNVTQTLPAGSYTVMGADTANNSKISEMIIGYDDTAEKTYCTISGKVTDADGNAVSGITVVLDNGTATTTTGADGSYLFDNNVLADAAHTVQTKATGMYKAASTSVTASEAKANETIANKDMTVNYAGVVNVVVTMDGDPYTGTDVYLANHSDETFESRNATLSVDGKATFDNLPAGTYEVSVYGKTATATVTISETNTTATANIAVLPDYEATIKLAVTNNSGTDATLYIRNKLNQVVDTITVPTTGYNNDAYVITTGTYFTGCTTALVDKTSFFVNETTTEVALVLTPKVDKAPLIAGTYDFSAAGNAVGATGADNKPYFNNQGGEQKTDYLKLIKNENDKLFFDLDDTKNVTFTFSNKTLSLEMEVIENGVSKWVAVEGSPFTKDSSDKPMVLSAGKYRVSAGETGTGGLYLKKIVVEDVIETNATGTVTVTNNASVDVSVSVDGSNTAAQTVAAGATATLTFANLPAGDHNINITATGATIKQDVNKISVTPGAETASATVIVTQSNTVKVRFVQVEGDEKNPGTTAKAPGGTVTVSGAGSGTVSKTADTYLEFDAEPGDKFNFKSDSTTITSISKNSDNMKIGFDQSSVRIFEFIVPTGTAPADGYVIQFNNSDGYKKLSGDNGPATTSTLGYGQYGYGAAKVYLCGNNAREAFEYYGCYATMYDFTKGYSDEKTGKFADYILDTTTDHTNGYGYALLNGADTTNSYITFTTSADIETGTTLMIDASTSVSKASRCALYDSTGALVSPTTAGTSSKYLYTVGPNETYTIKGTSSSAYTYIKSIRTFNPNNVFVPVLNEATRFLGVESAIAGDLHNSLGLSDSTSSSKGILRLITKVAPDAAKGAGVGALESILRTDYTSFGYKVMPTDIVDTYNTAVGASSTKGGYYTPGKSTTASDTNKTDLETWENMTTNDYAVTEMLNTGVMKMNIDNGVTDDTMYDDVADVPTSKVTSDMLLVGDTDATKPDKRFEVAYSEQFVRISAGEYYFFPYTLYSENSGSGGKAVYNEYNTSKTETNWMKQMNVLHVTVAADGTVTVDQNAN